MKLHLIIVINILCCVFCDEKSDNDERKLTMTLNPDCEKQLGSECDGLTLVHVKAEAADNILHFIWDFTGKPSLFLAKTDLNATLNMNWTSFMNGEVYSVNFTSQPEFVFSAVISKIFLFNDASDKADIDDESVKEIITIDPRKFTWMRENLTQIKDDHVMLVMNSSVYGSNGSFAMQLSAFGSSKHGAELPHLFHSSHSMQIDLVAENIDFSNFSSTRVAIEFLVVSSENKTEGTFKLNKRRNLDDEFTPGIFDVYDIVSPRSNDDSRGAFLQYRPVCYTTKGRTVSDSTELKQGNIKSLNNNSLEIETNFMYTFPMSFYGYNLGSKVVQGSNITFGVPNDGFYLRSNYTSFSMLMGIGAPPIEKLSAFVITFAAIGLGVPFLVLLVGGTYLTIKRYNSN